MRSFNITGLCVPKEDYMVDISDKLDKIIALIDKKSYSYAAHSFYPQFRTRFDEVTVHAHISSAINKGLELERCHNKTIILSL
jgi:hypothetical protein